MSIPQYRYVEYTDDGCSRYECLNCYCQFEVRDIPWKYCPGCG
jgi:rRNA maturation endonuclease Nob1